MKLSSISSFKPGSTIHGFYICKQKSHRNTKNGDLYLDVILQDKTGRISAKIWDDVIHFDNLFESSEPVAVKGKVENYNFHNQLVIQQIKRADVQTYQKYGFSLSELIEKVDDSIDDLWDLLNNAIKSLKNPYKKLIKLILKKFDKEIKSIPATLNHHYPISGGFLKYITNMITSADFLMVSYKNLDRDLIIAGIILHDIGKVRGLQYSTVAEHTDAGKLMGHEPLGLEILNEILENIKIDEAILFKLKNIIMYHKEYSQDADHLKLQFPEVLFINLLSNLIGKMDFIQRDINNY